jgi:uncharacterized DUF497 family protein
MTPLRFEWDPKKSRSNRLKHGVSLEEASTIFEDDDALLIPDDDHSHTEPRFVLLGISAHNRLLTVVHCERAGGNVIRLISARKANPIERGFYQRGTLP